MSSFPLESQRPLDIECVKKLELVAGDGQMWWENEQEERVSPAFDKPSDALEWRNSRGFGEQPISEPMKKQVARINAQLEEQNGRGN